MSKNSAYPDISDLLAAKAKGRLAFAALSFAEKLALLDQLRDASRSFEIRKAPLSAANN